VSLSPRQSTDLNRTGGPTNSSHLIFPKHKRLIPLFFTEGVEVENKKWNKKQNKKSNNIREVKLVLEKVS